MRQSSGTLTGLLSRYFSWFKKCVSALFHIKTLGIWKAEIVFKHGFILSLTWWQPCTVLTRLTLEWALELVLWRFLTLQTELGRLKLHFFSFLLLRDLSIIWPFSVYNCGPSSDCMFMLRSNQDFAFRKLKSMEGVTYNTSKALFNSIVHKPV